MSDDPYRHPFVGPSRDDTITKQANRIKELEASLAKAVEALEEAKIPKIQRYVLYCDYEHETYEVECSEGEWVRYEDFAAFETKLTKTLENKP